MKAIVNAYKASTSTFRLAHKSHFWKPKVS